MKKLKNKIGKMVAAATVYCDGLIISAVTALADETTAAAGGESGGADISAILEPINTLKMIGLGIVGVIGFFLCLWGIVDFGVSFVNHDPTAIPNAVKKLAGGLIIASASILMGIFGF